MKHKTLVPCKCLVNSKKFFCMKDNCQFFASFTEMKINCILPTPFIISCIRGTV